MNFSIIKKSELEGALRIDAEYYQLEYLELNQKLVSIAHVKLGEIAFITDGEHGSPIFDESSGIKYFSAQHPQDGFIDSDAKMISKVIDTKNKRSSLKVGDVLLSTVGTIGNAGIVTEDLLPANIDRHVARIALNKGTISPEFLIAFLISKFGKFQSIRESTGNVQLNLFIDKIKDFIIPSIKNIDVTRLMQQSLSEREKSKSLYFQAENLLLEELGLKNFEAEIKRELWSVVDLSVAQKVNRIDADYFQPKYQKLMSLIRANSGMVLGEIATVKKGFEPGSEAYQEEGKLFIRVSSISKDGVIDKDQKYLKEELYEKLKKEYQPKVGEILLTKDASPGMAYVVKEPIEGVVSGGVLRVKIKENIEPEYLALVINSVVGQLQVERDAGGSIIMHWKPDQVKEMQIPILSKPIQQQIAELVQKSHEARKKAKELLEEAKNKVEELIEN